MFHVDKLARLRELPCRQRALLPMCLAGIMATHLALTLFGYQRTNRLIERFTHHDATRPATEAQMQNARDLARIIEIAGRHGPVQHSCLRRSLMLYGLLRRKCLRRTLELGLSTQPTTTAFEAHAWVELEGKRLLDSDSAYAIFQHTARLTKT